MDVASILIADSQLLFSEALGAALKWQPDLNVLDLFPTTGRETVEAAGRLKPDVLLVDRWLPETDGLTAAAMLKTRVPGTKIMILSWLHSVDDFDQATAAGAVAFLPKTINLMQLIEAIRRAASGEFPIDEAEIRKAIDKLRKRGDQAAEIRQRVAGFSRREMDVLRLLGRGRFIAEIAKELGIAEYTVKIHAHHMVRKANARTKEEVVAMARYCGLIQ